MRERVFFWGNLMKERGIWEKFFPKTKEKKPEIGKVLNDIRMKIGDIQRKIELVSGDESCEKLKELSLEELRIVMIKLRQAVDAVGGRETWVRKEIDRIRAVW